MKRRIFLATAAFCLVFGVAGVFIARTIKAGTAELDGLIQMHRVALLREQLLFRVRTVKSDIKTRSTRFFQGAEDVVRDAVALEKAVRGCLSCHHSPAAESTISGLLDQTLGFEGAVSRVLTVRANEERLAREEDVAWMLGSELEDRVNAMIASTSAHLEQQTGEVVSRITASNRILFFLLALGPALAAGLAILFVKSFARPVAALLEATRALKAGDLGYRVEGLTNEFGEVADSFNEMAGALQTHMEHLQRAEQMVVCGKVAAGLAHEIKNPLAGVQISLQVLAEELVLSAEDRGIFEGAKQEIQRIDLLVKGLLDFARPRKPQLVPVDVNDVVERAVALTTQRVPTVAGNGRKVSVTRELEQGLPQTIADPNQLLQVLLNLMLNAVEAMPEGGEVCVVTRSAPGIVEVDVTDTGPGVGPELAERIFEPFFTGKSKGTGLGLSISLSLIEQLGGTIRVANRPEGGARFTVIVPLREAALENIA